MTILIIEDEPLAAKRIRRLLTDIAQEQGIDCSIVGMCDSIAGTIAWIQARQEEQLPMPNLALCDIRLGDGQSFEIFEQVPIDFPVIFTTAFDEYALRAFKLNSIDYLLKPIKKEELQNALKKYQRLAESLRVSATTNGERQHASESTLMQTVLRQLSALHNTTQPSYRSRFLVRHGDGFQSIMIEDVAYFYSEHKITHLIRHDGKRALVDEPLDELIPMLNPQHFYRANRQVIVSARAMTAIHRYFNGKLKLTLTPREPFDIIVSKESASEFKAWLDR